MKTIFLLLMQFETANIPLSIVAKHILTMSPDEAKKRASAERLPFPTFRGGSQKSERLVDIVELANYLDDVKEKAKKEWLTMQEARRE